VGGQPNVDLRTESDYDVSQLRSLLSRPGCLAWVLLLLLIAGIVVWIVVVDDDPDPTGQTATGGPVTASASSSAGPGGGCVDATADFRTFAASRAGRGAAMAVETMPSVCFEPGGALRAESVYPVDIEASSEPMRFLCTGLPDFIAGAGREWKGFTVYSVHRLSPGVAILTSTTEGDCANPQRQEP
jgi:hypothetical protein